MAHHWLKSPISWGGEDKKLMLLLIRRFLNGKLVPPGPMSSNYPIDQRVASMLEAAEKAEKRANRLRDLTLR